ncbi:hypothetical protein [Streptomyces sp. NPDC055607]
MTPSALREQSAALLDAAGRIDASVRTAGWLTPAADEALDAVDILLGALGEIGPEIRDALAPVRERLAALQARLLAQEKALKERPAARPRRQVPRGARVPRPGDDPEDWIEREEWHAEKLFLMLQQHGAREEWMRLAAVFDALPVQAQRAATCRVADTGECWAVVLEGPDSPRPELTAMPVRP